MQSAYAEKESFTTKPGCGAVMTRRALGEENSLMALGLVRRTKKEERTNVKTTAKIRIAIALYLMKCNIWNLILDLVIRNEVSCV